MVGYGMGWGSSGSVLITQLQVACIQSKHATAHRCSPAFCFLSFSQVGVVDIDPSCVVRKGRLTPGQLLLLDFNEHRIIEDAEVGI